MKGTAPTVAREIFYLNEENIYELRSHTDFTIRAVDSIRNRLENLSCLIPKIWEIEPLDSNQTKPLPELKAKLRNGTLKIDHTDLRYICKILVLFLKLTYRSEMF